MSRLYAGCIHLGIVTVLLLRTANVFAAESAPEALPEVVVSSTRLPGDPVESRTLPAKITIITAEDIQHTGSRTVQEAIQYATGIVMYDQVGNAFQQTVDLRGFNGQPVPVTSVFVDGVRVNEPDFNTVNFDMIPIETIERIEIQPGASAIYGKDALGGVINIITKRGKDKPQVTAETMFGSFHRERYTITSSGTLGKLDYFSSFARETETGFRDESDARISRFFGKLGYRPSEGSDLAVSYTYVKDRLMQAGSLPLSLAAIDRKANFTPGDFYESETNFVRMTARQTLPLGFTLSGNAFYRRPSIELFTVSQPVLVGGMLSVATTPTKLESRGATVQLQHEAVPAGHRNLLVFGGELTRNDVGSRLSSTSDFGVFTNRRDTDEDVWAAYVQDTFHLTSQLLLTGGVRYDKDKIATDFEDTFTLPGKDVKTFSRTTPKAGLTYLMTPDTSLYFSYSQGFRVPTIDELFTISGAANPNLKAVHSNNYEVGAKQKLATWGEGSLALFRSDVRNEIFFTCNTCDPFSPNFDGLNRNVDESRRQGIEATVKGRYTRYLSAAVNYTYTEAVFLTPIKLSATQIIERGDSFPLVPKHRLGVTANFTPVSEWTFSLTGLYQSTQFFLNDEPNSQPRLPGFFTLNGRVTYERQVPGGRLAAFFLMNNIWDQKYFTSGILAANILTGGGATERFVVPAPGIAVYGGLSYRFESF